ncbi:desmoplakin-B-like [Gadus chalcogrammus]|uniref:desmoplakin-B-like n=1 Tax=Gadus chalcogrammus TaxID=1042646 RepID=UPI0024C4E39A|nr:desmoplakin-B-like [Gadus chalcogrammus]
MKKGLVDKKTALTLLQAQESAGGILDPVNSIFLPRDIAVRHKLIDEELKRSLIQQPECYVDPDTEKCVTYESLKRRCKTEPETGLLLLPISETQDPKRLIFDGIRKPVTAQQLLDCEVLDKPTFNQLLKKEKTMQEVSTAKKVSLKGTGVIAAVIAGDRGKMSFAEAKKHGLIPIDSANKLLEAQAATGHIIDPGTNEKLTVVEACDKGVVAKEDRERLLAAEYAAVGYTDRSTAKPLSVFEAMKKGLVDKKTALTLLQAQESAGGVLDPVNSIFLPRDIAVKRKVIDEELKRSLIQQPECYVDPDTERGVTYESLKRRCKTEPETGLLLLPIFLKKDPTKQIFEGVRQPVTAQQLLDCDALDKPSFTQQFTGKISVLEVSTNKKYTFEGTEPIAEAIAGNQGQKFFAEAKMKGLLLEDCANIRLEAQAGTGDIIDPRTNQKLNVKEACDKGEVAIEARDRLLAAESAAIGYIQRTTAKPISVFEATKKGIVDRMQTEKTTIERLETEEKTVTLVSTTKKVNLKGTGVIATVIGGNQGKMSFSDTKKQHPEDYMDTEMEKSAINESSKTWSKTESHSTLLRLPISKQQDSTKLIFDGIRKTVTAQQLMDCGVLDKKTFTLLLEGKKTVSDVSVDKKLHLKGTGSIGGIAAGPLGKMSFTEARNREIISADSAIFLLEAQAATGYIIDPRTDQKLTVEEAYSKGVIDPHDRSRLSAVEAAALGYQDPNTSKLLTASQAMRKGLIDKDTALRILQAQESVGGILDPFLGVFLPRDIAMDRNIIDKELYNVLNSIPDCFLDPNTQHRTNYASLKRKCKLNPTTGLLLLPAPHNPLTVQGLRGKVSLSDLVDANLLENSDVENIREGILTIQDIEQRLQSYLRGSTCIAGVYDETSNRVMPIYEAMKEGLLAPGTTLELLEAQAASGFVVDPVKNINLTVTDALNRGLVGPEFKDKLLSAERAVTGYKLPDSDKMMSIFETMERGLMERGLGIRLLEAQIASGGIIDPIHSHRIDVNVAYKRGYFNAEIYQILADEGDDTKGYCDPNTDEKHTYMELKQRCIFDENTGLILLPILDNNDQQHSTQRNTLRKRRVIIVDPDTNREMTVREALNTGLIDYNTYIELSMQECEWEEITTTSPDGSSRMLIVDKKTGKEYNISELLEQGVIDQSIYEQYTSQSISLNEFAAIIGGKRQRFSKLSLSLSSSSSSLLNQGNPGDTVTSAKCSSISTRPLSQHFGKCTTTRTTTVSGSSSIVSREVSTSAETLKHLSGVSVIVSSTDETIGEQEPVGAIFDADNLEKVPILEARNRGIVDSITAQRMLEAQACTGGIVDPSNGQRHGIKEACVLGLIDDKLAPLLKSAEKAYVGFENVRVKSKLSAAEAMKEKWLPYEAGQRFMEYQFVTGGLFDPELGCRRTIEDALNIGWLDESTARKLQDSRRHSKNLTCPKTKLKISYKEALDNCLLEETTGVRMLQASSMSSRGISSPYSISSAPGSRTCSRSSSRVASRRSSVDLGTPTSSVSKQISSTSYSLSSFSSSSAL